MVAAAELAAKGAGQGVVDSEEGTRVVAAAGSAIVAVLEWAETAGPLLETLLVSDFVLSLRLALYELYVQSQHRHL